MGGRARKGILPPAAVLALFVPLLFAVLAVQVVLDGVAPASAAAESRAPAGEALERQSRALVEQDLGVALQALGRPDDAGRHFRIAVGLDPWLKAPWIALASRALEDGAVEQAAHLAGMAVAIAPQDETARRLLEQCQAGLPATDGARRAAAPACGPWAEPPLDEAARARQRSCLERRAGLLASAGSPEPLTELARLDLAENKPESAALLLTIAGTMGGGDSALLGKALALSGNPCGAAAAGSDPAWQEACGALRSRRAQVEREVRTDLDGLDTASRLVAAGRIEALLGAGLDPASAARRWRIDRRRGERALVDMEGLTARPGQEWTASRDPAGTPGSVWLRRPGDAAIVVFGVRSDRQGGAEAAVRALLTARRPAPVAWAPAALASTDPVRARTSALALDADSGGRVEGVAWLVESDAAPGRALVVAAYFGTSGLGGEGLEQTRAEIQEALAEAIVVPPRWDQLTILDAADGEEFPVPIAGGRTAPGDENASPWRTYPAGEFTLALPPGLIAALPSTAPTASAPRRASAALWFRGRFRDRDGVDVALGDESRAGAVDLQTLASEADAKVRALGRGGTVDPPLSDPGAVFLSTLDVTRTLGAETGASAVSLTRFRPSALGVEWLVCRLAFGSRVMEIDLPAVTGAKSIALYWIPATVRPVHGLPPPPPIDLSGRLGILYLRPPPTERRESFYKEGDLRSAEFTMIVARGYAVVLDTVSPDAFPVRLTHMDGAAIARLEKLPADPSRPAEPPAGALSGQLEGLVRAWLAREGLELTGDLVPHEDFKLSRSGATAGLDVTFSAAPVRGRGQDRAAGPAADADVPIAGPATGRAVILYNREGAAFAFLGLSWDRDGARRAEEIDLMIGSLRLLRRKPAAAGPGGGSSR